MKKPNNTYEILRRVYTDDCQLNTNHIPSNTYKLFNAVYNEDCEALNINICNLDQILDDKLSGYTGCCICPPQQYPPAATPQSHKPIKPKKLPILNEPYCKQTLKYFSTCELNALANTDKWGGPLLIYQNGKIINWDIIPTKQQHQTTRRNTNVLKNAIKKLTQTREYLDLFIINPNITHVYAQTIQYLTKYGKKRAFKIKYFTSELPHYQYPTVNGIIKS